MEKKLVGNGGKKGDSVTHVSERGRINDLLFTNHPLLLFPIQWNEYFIRGRNKWWVSWMFSKRPYASLAIRLSPRVRRWSTSIRRGWIAGQILADYTPPSDFPGGERTEVGKVVALECIYIDPSVEDNLKGQGFRFDLSIEGRERGGGGRKKMGEEKEKSYISRGITNASAGGTWRGTFRRYSFHGEGVEVLLN